MFIWGNFHPGYRGLCRKNQDLRNQACMPSHISEHIDIICFQRIHIRSLPVVPDHSKAIRTSKITPKVILWTSKVLLNHNIFIRCCHVHYSMYRMVPEFRSLLVHLKLSQSKTDTTVARNNVFAEGCSSLCSKSVKDSRGLGKSCQGNPNFA